MPQLERILQKTADIKDHECFTNFSAVKNGAAEENLRFCFDDGYIYKFSDIWKKCLEQYQLFKIIHALNSFPTYQNQNLVHLKYSFDAEIAQKK